MGEHESTSNVRGMAIGLITAIDLNKPPRRGRYPMAITGVKWSLQPWIHKPQTAI
jgi:hypothetical protein